MRLFEIRLHHVDEFLCSPRSLRRRLVVRVNDVEADMSLDDLGHEPVDGATARGDRLQDRRAVFLLLEQPFDGVDLAADTTESVQQLLLVADGMSHGGLPGTQYTIPQ